jgi:hypothetical protein
VIGHDARDCEGGILGHGGTPFKLVNQ